MVRVRDHEFLICQQGRGSEVAFVGLRGCNFIQVLLFERISCTNNFYSQLLKQLNLATFLDVKYGSLSNSGNDEIKC